MKGAPIRYSAEEMAWLEANRDMVISDYCRAFVARFGRHDVSTQNLHALRKRRGWKVGRDPSRYKGRNMKYSAAERDWIREHIGLETAECHRQFVARFGREDVTVEKLVSLRKRNGWTTGRDTRFRPGQISHNKGVKCAPGAGGLHPNARRTQFKGGALPHNTKGAGHERIDSKDGYAIVIVDETNPWTGAKTRPVHKHRWLWEQQHGPIPDGMVLKCLDGDKLNTDPSNWELVPRAILPRLNGGPRNVHIAYDSAPQELKPTILAVAKLAHQVREKRKGADHA